MADDEKAVAEGYGRLVSLLKDEEFADAIDSCEALLAKAGDGAEEVERTRILCLIHNTDFEEAIEAIDANPKLGMGLERAYAQYSLHQSADALAAVQALERTAAAQHLEAQTRYRMGQYDEAAGIYQQLHDGGEDSGDFKANLLASFAASGRAGEGAKLFKAIAADEWAGVYNGACVQISAGLLDEARDTLVAAKRLGQEQLEMDDYEPEEIAEELAVVDVQLGYVEQVTNGAAGAVDMYSAVVQEKPDDAAVLAVARNNLVACKGERDLFDGFKHMKSAANTPERKLQGYQRKTIGTNHALVLMFMGKNKDCREAIDKLNSQFPGDEQVAVLYAALAYRQKNYKKVEQVLRDCIKGSQGGAVLVQLTLAQFHINQRDLREAADVLLAIAPLQHEPAMVATVVNLLDQVQDKERPLVVLDAAVAHWKSRKDSAKLGLLLQECAAWKLKKGMKAEALETFSSLIKLQPDNHSAVALAIEAAAHIKPELAKQFQQMLPPLDSADGYDGEELEASVAPRIDRRKAKADAAPAPAAASAAEPAETTATAAAVAAIAKKKKKKKIRYPKNYNPDKPGTPDPERWLPRRERTGAKKSRRRRHTPAATGAQVCPLPDPFAPLWRRRLTVARVLAPLCCVQGGEKAGLSAKEAAKLAALDKSDKKGSSLDATTGSAREGSGNPTRTNQPPCRRRLRRRVWSDAGVAARSERPVAEPVQEPAPQPQRQQSGKKSKKKKKKK